MSIFRGFVFVFLFPVMASAVDIFTSDIVVPIVETPAIEFCPTSVFIGFQIKNYKKNPAIHCADVQAQIESAFKTVQTLAPFNLQAPMLVIKNLELPRGGSYGWVITTMTMGIPNTANMQNQIVTFYHEMGHKIYFEYMSKTVPEVADHLPAIQKYAVYLAKCATAASSPADCDPQQAATEIQAANDSFSKDFDSFIYVDKAYNEMFADLVASLATGDQNAIAKAVGPCGGKDVLNCEYRAFSKNTIDYNAGTVPYSRFSPIRRDLWDAWVAPRLGDKPALLGDLAQLFVTESFSNYEKDSHMIEGFMALAEINALSARMGLKKTESASLSGLE